MEVEWRKLKALKSNADGDVIKESILVNGMKAIKILEIGGEYYCDSMTIQVLHELVNEGFKIPNKIKVND